MKRFLLASVAIATLASGTAFAADLGVRRAAPIPVATAPGCAQFGGFYIGGHAGWTHYRNDWTDQDNYGFNQTFQDHVGDGSMTDDSWHAGAQLGYNMQRGCVVFGVQIDGSWSGAEASRSYVDFPVLGAGRLDATSELRWMGTARTRAGIVVDSALLYLTGGFAFARFDRNFTYSIGAAPADVTIFAPGRTRLGLVVGAGTEWALGNNWSLNSEILYMSFLKDEQTLNCPTVATCPNGVVGTPFRYTFQDSAWVGRFGLNYRWGGSAVVARY